MKKITLILIFVLTTFSSLYSQKKTKISDIFSSYMCIDNILQIRNNKGEYINCFDEQKNISIEGSLIGKSNILSIEFYKFSLGKNQMNYSLRNSNNLIINSSYCNNYIIAFNTKNSKSYRLKGFNGNDFLSLLRDLKKDSSSKYKKLVKELQLITKEIDFYCLYKSYKKFNLTNECLVPCSSPLPAH